MDAEDQQAVDTAMIALDGTANVVVIVAELPFAIEGIVQGNGVVQAPLFETNVRPAGVGSLTITFAAADGPAGAVNRAGMFEVMAPTMDSFGVARVPRSR